MKKFAILMLTALPLLLLSVSMLQADNPPRYYQDQPQYVAPPPVVYPQYPVYVQPYDVDPGQTEADAMYKANQHRPP